MLLKQDVLEMLLKQDFVCKHFIDNLMIYFFIGEHCLFQEYIYQEYQEYP